MTIRDVAMYSGWIVIQLQESYWTIGAAGSADAITIDTSDQ